MIQHQRLNYEKPSGTVLNVRKSMWIHPTINRAVSVREAARLQTFPDSFVFCGTKDSQYQQVGNAVPPILAEANMKKLDKDRNSVHSKVRATYTTFTSDGKKYFQIDTYGSPTREMKDKISQSIQVDKEMAKELIKLMMDTFDVLE